MRRLSFVRCRVLVKQEVGRVHLHSRWWRPNTLSSMWFQPVGRSVMYPVPEGRHEDVLHAESFEQAMAVVRAEDAVPADASAAPA